MEYLQMLKQSMLSGWCNFDPLIAVEFICQILINSEDDDSSGDDEDEEDDDVLCDMRSDSGQRSPDFNDDTKSRFTEYSMTSSVIRRNAQLSLLDDRFEQVSWLSFDSKTTVFMAFYL